METYDPQKALRTLGFLNGDFLVPDTSSSHSRGFRMIFGVIMTAKITCLELLPRIYIGITTKLTMVCAPDSIFRFIFGGLLLPFLSMMIFFHTHIYNGVLPQVKNNAESWALIYLCFLAMVVINYLLVFCTGAHDLNNGKDREYLENAVKNNQYLNKKPPTCSKCGIPNVLRSFHCPICNTHTAKFHEHSMIFNKCIGAGNVLFYTSFQFFLAVFLLTGAAILTLEREQPLTSKAKKMALKLLVVIYLVTGLSRLWTCVQHVAYMYYNITAHEAKNWNQLAYLWKSMRKEFYNPFDKGPSNNFKEEIYTIINYNEEPEKKRDVSLEEQKPMQTAEDLEDKERKALQDERNKAFNWRTHRLVTLTDVYSSPLRKFFIDYFNQKQKKKKGASSDSDSD